MNLAVELCGVTLKNPVIAASGCFGFGREMAAFGDLGRLGGIALKAVTLERREGNPPPRIAETPSGALNSVGLQNPGLEAFLREEVPWLETLDTALIANIAGSTPDEYCRVAEGMGGTAIPFVELNISCPNVREGGAAFGTRPERVFEITRAVRAVCRKKLIVKLSPNTADIAENARAAEEAGADGVSLINTLTGMAIDVHTRRPVLGGVTGGLSGPAIRPVALRMVWQAARAVRVPVVGMGGILTGEDAVAFLLAGARAVMVGTANLIHPDACLRVVAGIEEYMRRHGVDDVNELIGALEV
jgi:dihydroorotate dehydrogenase (NAD+) catalytic subunit